MTEEVIKDINKKYESQGISFLEKEALYREKYTKIIFEDSGTRYQQTLLGKDGYSDYTCRMFEEWSSTYDPTFIT